MHRPLSPPTWLRGPAALLTTALLLSGAATASARAPMPTCFGSVPTRIGTPGDDRIEGTEGNDVIVTLEGDDVVASGEGDDRICSGGGDDEVYPGVGYDAVRAAGGHDVLDDPDHGLAYLGDGDDASTGANVAEGGRGDDRLQPVAGATAPVEFTGGRGDDRLVGTDVAADGEGDVLEGGAGDDIIFGRASFNDIAPGPGRDVVYMGRHRHTWSGRLDYSAAEGPMEVDLAGGFARGQGRDELHGKITQVYGSPSDDRLVGRTELQNLVGYGGDDVIVGRGGPDRLYGGKGCDRTFGGRGRDTCRSELRRNCEFE